MEDLQRSLDRCVEKWSRKVAPRQNTVDKAGRDQDDYAQLFRLKAFEAVLHFQKTHKPKTKQSEEYYAQTAIRHRSTSVLRELGRHPEIARLEFEPSFLLTPNLETVMARRDLVGKLRERMESGDWEVLTQYVLAGENASEAWRTYGRGFTRRGYFLLLQTAKCRARRILKNLEKVVPKKNENAS